MLFKKLFSQKPQPETDGEQIPLYIDAVRSLVFGKWEIIFNSWSFSIVSSLYEFGYELWIWLWKI